MPVTEATFSYIPLDQRNASEDDPEPRALPEEQPVPGSTRRKPRRVTISTKTDHHSQDGERDSGRASPSARNKFPIQVVQGADDPEPSTGYSLCCCASIGQVWSVVFRALLFVFNLCFALLPWEHLADPTRARTITAVVGATIDIAFLAQAFAYRIDTEGVDRHVNSLRIAAVSADVIAKIFLSHSDAALATSLMILGAEIALTFRELTFPRTVAAKVAAKKRKLQKSPQPTVTPEHRRHYATATNPCPEQTTTQTITY